LNKINGIVLVCSLVMLSMLLITINASAAVVTNVNIPINEVLFNPCNGETVTLTGVSHVVVTTTLDGAGGSHNTMQNNIHLAGSGSLGNSYEGNMENTTVFNARVAVASTFVATLSMISNGSAPNFELHILLHATQKPDGTIAVFVSHFSAGCPA
jgi:hypothetical protein